MYIGYYGSTREPVLTPIERIALDLSQKSAWIDKQIANCEGEVHQGGIDDKNRAYHWSRGYGAAVREIQEYLKAVKP